VRKRFKKKPGDNARGFVDAQRVGIRTGGHFSDLFFFSNLPFCRLTQKWYQSDRAGPHDPAGFLGHETSYYYQWYYETSYYYIIPMVPGTMRPHILVN
jgi:hypothetical protein